MCRFIESDTHTDAFFDPNCDRYANGNYHTNGNCHTNCYRETYTNSEDRSHAKTSTHAGTTPMTLKAYGIVDQKPRT